MLWCVVVDSKHLKARSSEADRALPWRSTPTAERHSPHPGATERHLPWTWPVFFTTKLHHGTSKPSTLHLALGRATSKCLKRRSTFSCWRFFCTIISLSTCHASCCKTQEGNLKFNISAAQPRIKGISMYFTFEFSYAQGTPNPNAQLYTVFEKLRWSHIITSPASQHHGHKTDEDSPCKKNTIEYN